MGDRGGTATTMPVAVIMIHYTRWEIGGEPQRSSERGWVSFDYTRWEIGGEPQPSGRCLLL